MNVYLEAWLIYAVLGIGLGLFPAYILTSATVSMAVMMYNKNVPLWLIRFSNGNVKTRRWDITPFKTVPAQHRAEFIGAIVWLVVAIGVVEFIIINNFINTGSVDALLLHETSFPVLLALTVLVPYLTTKRYVYSLGEYTGKREKETRKNKGF
jgi:hypothetical protein